MTERALKELGWYDFRAPPGGSGCFIGGQGIFEKRLRHCPR